MAEALRVECQCCVVGGGPAGLMAGFLLARAGANVIVLEKHADFLRDFRGDTIHPSTLGIMRELGLLEAFLRLPHQKAYEIGASIGDRKYAFADFRSLPKPCNFIALMPQWDFLNFIAAQAQKLPNFRLMMRTPADQPIWEGERVVGVTATSPEGPVEIRADLVVAADGRASTLRAAAGLAPEDYGAPMDVLWFKMPRKADDPDQSFGRIASGRMIVMIDRGEYWQCGWVIPKGGAEVMRAQGLEAFRAALVGALPFLADRAGGIDEWEKLNLLTVQVNRLKNWSLPGLLCIGDAAHAMSPVGGVGVNLAVQDAVATANLLGAKLAAGTLHVSDLAAVQKRREFPAKAAQRIQLAIQNRVVSGALDPNKPFEPPLALRLLDAIPLLRQIPARVLGLGLRPEHVAPSITARS
ncbi:FAD-dependent oxidoreductase [Methylocystis sp. JAN1]|uniref:FAD-dependent oxidoreductase n=1 Tax=Methylocystis sp. JAN1 TaxID=3397211 RepID=UPI003FA318A3